MHEDSAGGSTILDTAPEPGWYLVRVRLEGDAADDPAGVVLRFLPEEGDAHIVFRHVPRRRGRPVRVVHVPVLTRRVAVELVGGAAGVRVDDVRFTPLPGPVGPLLSLGDYVATTLAAGRPGLGELARVRRAHRHGGTGAARAHLAVVYEQQMHRRAVDADDYPAWRRRFVELDGVGRTELRRRLAGLPGGGPLISVVMGVHDPRPAHLEEALESVREQLHERWELCVVDDASTDPEVRALLDHYAASDARIRVQRRGENIGIAAASNQALAAAAGEWVAFIDHDDRLEPFALAAVALAAERADILYTDEDKVDDDGDFGAPHFKPPWNPELLLGHNYMSHLTAMRRSLVESVGGIRSGIDGAQDHDLLLRATAVTPFDRIGHIPLVAYSWRATEGSTALSIDEKPGIGGVGRGVIEDHLGPGWTVTEAAPTAYAAHPPTPPDRPPVSVVIPTRDRLDLLERCVETLATTSWPHDVTIVDNGSEDPATLDWLERFDGRSGSVIRHAGPFNFSAICNAGVAATDMPLVLLLNNDVEVIEPEWLERMVAWIDRNGVGIVGAKLLYDDETIQHAGVVLGLGGVAGHGHLHEPGHRHGYHNRLRLTHEVGAVTGACLLTTRDVWDAVGGFDEELGVAFNDIDFCIRVRTELGRRTLWTPDAVLVHHESLSRGPEDSLEKVGRYMEEAEMFTQRWAHVYGEDPAYSPNLALDGEAFVRTNRPRGVSPADPQPRFRRLPATTDRGGPGRP